MRGGASTPLGGTGASENAPAVMGPRQAVHPHVVQEAVRERSDAGQGYLSGNFAPIDQEVSESDLLIEGNLPPALEGVYVRNGPNPHFPPDSPSKHHWYMMEE